MRLIYADYNPYTNSIDVNTFENYILRIAAFCGLSFLLAIKISIPPPSAGGTNSNESVSTLYVVL